MGRVVGVAADYDQLRELLRRRTEELHLSREVLDDIAGFSACYSTKLLTGGKFLGPMSLGSLLGALGVKIALVVDEEASARVCGRWIPRDERYARNGAAGAAARKRSAAAAAAEPIDGWAAIRGRRSA